MERFYLEEPCIKRKDEARDFIEEFINCNSKIYGSGGLDDEYKNYEKWLETNELKKYPDTCPDNKCPGFTYFLIRENDNKIIGMINIRYNLNEFMLRYGGHIGYSIRPSERNKGYNKINLFLGLIKIKELGVDNVLITAVDSNPGSFKTILSLGGVLENKIPDDEEEDVLLGRYWINIDESINKYYEEYEDRIILNKAKNK